MKVLGIETSGALCGCAVVEGGQPVGRRVSEVPGMHVESLVHLIGDLLEEVSLEIGDLDGVAVSLGPGSFTGLRIGLGTAKGICFGTGLPLAGVPTLDAMAETVCPWDGNIVPVRDARRGEVYTATYRSRGDSVERTSGYRAISPEEAVREIAGLAARAMTRVTGDALERYGDLFRGALPDEIELLTTEHWTPDPAVVASIGARLLAGGITLDLGTSEPMYLRASEAERKARRGRPEASSQGGGEADGNAQGA